MRRFRAVPMWWFMLVVLLTATALVAKADPPYGAPTWWDNPKGNYLKACWDITWERGNATGVTLRESSLGFAPNAPEGTGYDWKDSWWGIDWDLTTRLLIVDIGNVEIPRQWKQVYVWWESSKGLDTAWPTLNAWGGQGTDIKKGKSDKSAGNGAFQYWRVFPQPKWERVYWQLAADETINKICIGTRCQSTPEASTCVLLGLSAVAGLFWCCRRKY